MADIAILPFVRQFANLDYDWFQAQDWQNLYRWLTVFLTSNNFNAIMIKYDKWTTGDPTVLFPN